MTWKATSELFEPAKEGARSGSTTLPKRITTEMCLWINRRTARPARSACSPG
jgi:hypothetical protein